MRMREWERNEGEGEGVGGGMRGRGREWESTPYTQRDIIACLVHFIVAVYRVCYTTMETKTTIAIMLLTNTAPVTI